MNNLMQNNYPPFSLFQKQLTISSSFEVLSANSDNSAWDSWGVRDVAILTDDEGSSFGNESKLSFYYTGSTATGQWQQTGRAISVNGGESWIRDPIDPVLRTSPGQWDEQVAATPWVIKYRHRFYLYYRGSRNACIEDAVGLAISDDGIHFKKHYNNPIISAKDFCGIRQFPVTIGVLNALLDYDGSLIVLFEAQESHFDNRGQIFAARSNDGINFKPINDGMPIFSSRDVNSWPVRGVCNPRMSRIGFGWYMLGFNGTYSGEYSIGLAFTKDFIRWHEHPSNPILVPRGWPAYGPFTYRLEGPCFDFKELHKDSDSLDCYLMAIPLGARNHEKAIIGKVTFDLKSEELDKINVHAFPVNSQSLNVGTSHIDINSTNEPSEFLQCHLIRKDINHFGFMLGSTLFTDTNSSVYVVLSNTVTGLSSGSGLIFRFNSDGTFYRINNSPRTSSFSLMSRIIRYLNRKVNTLRRMIDLYDSFPPAPTDGWSKCLDHAPTNFVEFSFRNSSDSFYKTLQVHHGNELLVELHLESFSPRVLTFASYKADTSFCDIKFT